MRRATDKPAHAGVRQRRRVRKRGRGTTANSLSRGRSPLVLLLLLLLWSICLGCGLGLALDVPPVPPYPPLTILPTDALLADRAMAGLGDGGSSQYQFSPPPHLPTTPSTKSSEYERTQYKGGTGGVGEVSQLPPKDGVAPGASGGTVDPVPRRYQLGQELYLQNCGTCHIALPPAVLPSETWRNLLQDQEHYGQKLPPLIGPDTLILWEYLRNFSRPPAAGEKVPYRVSESRYFKALHPRVKLPRNTKIASCVTCHPSAVQFNFRELTPEWANSP